MSIYVDDYDVQNPRATVMVHEEAKSAKVTYQGDNGTKFRVVVHQKPNPIGFSARLPGDRRKC